MNGNSTAARIGADAAQDKVIKQVNDNLVASVNTINKNVADGFTALNQADANKVAAREAKDNELNDFARPCVLMEKTRVPEPTERDRSAYLIC